MVKYKNPNIGPFGSRHPDDDPNLTDDDMAAAEPPATGESVRIAFDPGEYALDASLEIDSQDEVESRGDRKLLHGVLARRELRRRAFDPDTDPDEKISPETFQDLDEGFWDAIEYRQREIDDALNQLPPPEF
ncbi:MAG TPA: hypothetical protein VF572_05335 [Candidatus Saccharimonadales bacterium]|jgi:hypothetical protein